jgi:prepilin-type N-terminal cleavage/methylation domain-containing protein
MRSNTTKGFTLIELIVVIAIIGILATVGVASYSNVMQSARDSKRKSDLKELSVALQRYYVKNGTYQVLGAGSLGREGQGWLSVNSSTQPTYYRTTSIVEMLQSEGFLEVSEVYEPQPTSHDYLMVLCEGGQVYAVFAQLERPKPEDIINANNACGVKVPSAWNPVSQYQKNYAVTNKLY